MKKKYLNMILPLILIVVLVSELIYSISQTEFSKANQGETVQLVHNPWDTEVASTTVISLVLEEAGFNVNLVSVDNAIMYESLASG